MIAGLNYNSNGNAWTESNSVLEEDFSRWAADGIKHVSVRIMMSVMANTSPTTLSSTALANLKRVLDTAQKYGVKVHLDFWTQNTYALGRPSWLSGYDKIFVEPGRTNYINYMKTVVQAVKYHPAIEAYSVLNEPFFNGDLTKASAQAAFPLFYAAVKLIDPNRIVSCRFTLSYTPGSGRYDAAVYDIFDVFEITEYLDPRNPNDSRYNSVWSYWNKTVSDLIVRGKHLWVIEFGRSTDWDTDSGIAAMYKASLEKFAATGIVDRAYAWTYTHYMSEKFNLWTGSGVKPAYNELLAYTNGGPGYGLLTLQWDLPIPWMVNGVNYQGNQVLDVEKDSTVNIEVPRNVEV